MRTPVLFAGVYTLLSLAYTMLSWGRATANPAIVPSVEGLLVVHMVVHSTVGGLVALPSGRFKLALGAALAATLIDVDHVGQFLGLPLVDRASHSLGFMIAGGLAMVALVRWRYFKLEVPPLLAGALVVAVVLAHISVDSALPEAHMPFWMPVSSEPVAIRSSLSLVYATVGGLLVWGATLAEQRARRKRA